MAMVLFIYWFDVLLTARDIIAILQNLKAAGALEAEVEVI